METQISGEVQMIQACLKTVDHFKSFEIHNICNGAISTIARGGLDMVWIYSGLAILAAILIFIICGIVSLIKY